MKRREPLSLDMTPVVDIVFILLIFFLVSSVFKKDELALLLDLPEAGASKIIEENKNIKIELSLQELALNGKKVNFDELISKIKAQNTDEKLIMFHIDKEVPYARVVKVLDLLKMHSLNKLALITETK